MARATTELTLSRSSAARIVRAILTEMREPSEAMRTAGDQALSSWVAPAMHSGDAFTAMIDSILEGK